MSMPEKRRRTSMKKKNTRPQGKEIEIEEVS